MTLTYSQLRKIATSKKPKSSDCAAYNRWWRARRILGLSTAPKGKTKNYREYNRVYMRNYMRQYRSHD